MFLINDFMHKYTKNNLKENRVCYSFFTNNEL